MPTRWRCSTTEHGNWPYLLAIPLAVLVAMVSGVMLGCPTLRVRGDYLAIVTLGFGEIIRLTLVNSTWLGGAAASATSRVRPSVADRRASRTSNWDSGVAAARPRRDHHVPEFGVIGSAIP